MKNRNILSAALFLVAVLFSQRVDAQVSGSNTDVPRIMSYQGQITTTDGIAMNGRHNITATLYSDPHGTHSVWKGSYSAEVRNGIFNISLGSGAKKLPDNAEMNQPLWVGIKCDEGEEMQPLTQFASVPYALNVPDQSITLAKLAPEVVLGMGTGHTPTTQAILSDPCTSNNDGGVNTNVVAGGCVNVADPTAGYAAVGGGQSNQARAEYSAIAGGYGNQATNFASSALSGYENNVTGSYSTVTGGFINQALSANYSTIDGGYENTINNGLYTFIGGGYGNTVNKDYSAIMGGKQNTTSSTSQYSSIGGGYTNTISGDYSAIPGGRNLKVGTSSFGFNAGTSAVDVSSSASIGYFGDVDLWLGNDDNTARKLKFYEPSTSGSTFTSFRAGVQSANVEYILPAAIGSTDDALTLTNAGTGQLGWSPGSSTAWKILGNSNTDPVSGNFLGTTNNKNFEIHVYDSYGTANQGTGRVIRYEYNTGAGSSPNIIGGYKGNNISNNTLGGSVISGGGANNAPNLIGPNATANFSFIGGGRNNSIDALNSVIVGGGDGSNSNTIGTLADFSFIGGGSANTIDGSSDNTNKNIYSFIGGGYHNQIHNDPLNLSGETAHSSYATVVGGQNNEASEEASFVGGGENNIAGEEFSTIAGGQSNEIHTYHSAIVGGKGNINNGGGILPDGHVQGEFSFMGGGLGNTTAGQKSVICGGWNNVCGGEFAFIGGGGGADLNHGPSHLDFNEAEGFYAALAGGRANHANGSYAAIAGGDSNQVLRSDGDPTIGKWNSIGGGKSNLISAAASYATIPGGDSLIAQSYAQTVIGYYNLAQGTSTMPTNANRASINPFDRVFIIGAGQHSLPAQTSPPLDVLSEVRKNAFEVSNNGHSIVFHRNGAGPSSVRGATMTDNIIYGWAQIDGTTGDPVVDPLPSTEIESYAITKFAKGAAGEYTLQLNLKDEDNSTSIKLKSACITATLVYDGTCHFIFVEPINTANNQFKIHIRDNSNCIGANQNFMVQVVGRPKITGE